MKSAPYRNQELARVFKALSVEVRLRIVQMIRHRPLCVKAIAARLAMSQPAVSQHLRVLREAGLVSADKRGYFVHYRLNRDRLARCCARLDQLTTNPQRRPGR